MKRSGPIQRRTPLARATTPMRRSAMKAHPASRSNATVREMAVRRTAGRCVLCRDAADHAHHRKMRSQGGPDEVENLIPVCPACHEQIHHHPEWAYLHRLLIRSTDPIVEWSAGDWLLTPPPPRKDHHPEQR